MSFFIHSFPFAFGRGPGRFLISNISDQLRLPTCPVRERLGFRMKSYFRWVLRLRMRGATFPLFDTPSWTPT